jgi:hypothetical protein
MVVMRMIKGVIVMLVMPTWLIVRGLVLKRHLIFPDLLTI